MTTDLIKHSKLVKVPIIRLINYEYEKSAYKAFKPSTKYCIYYNSERLVFEKKYFRTKSRPFLVEILFSSLMCFCCALVAVVAFDFQFSQYNKSLYKVTFGELSLQKVEKKFQKQKVDNK